VPGPDISRLSFNYLVEMRWARLDERIEGLSDEIGALARQDKGCERLMMVPGIGGMYPLTLGGLDAAMRKLVR
jgi:transposase